MAFGKEQGPGGGVGVRSVHASRQLPPLALLCWLILALDPEVCCGPTRGDWGIATIFPAMKKSVPGRAVILLAACFVSRHTVRDASPHKIRAGLLVDWLPAQARHGTSNNKRDEREKRERKHAGEGNPLISNSSAAVSYIG
ncbi:unnamed protein product [Ectocarpus sp. 12 AP-2014]